MITHIACSLLTDDRGLDTRELAKSFGVPPDAIERIYNCALVVYDVASDQGQIQIKLPESAVDRCMKIAALRSEVGQMVATLFSDKPGSGAIRHPLLYAGRPPFSDPAPTVAGRESPVNEALRRPYRPAFDPVANQAYNLWTSLLFMARLISALSAIVVVGWLFRILIMGERGGWPIVGASTLILFCSWLASFFFAVQAECAKAQPRP